MSKILKQYQETKGAIDILQKELDELKPKVVEILEDAEGKVEISGASFSLRSSITYQYSNKVINLGNEIKLLKKEEFENGTATIAKESSSPVMKIIK